MEWLNDPSLHLAVAPCGPAAFAEAAGGRDCIVRTEEGAEPGDLDHQCGLVAVVGVAGAAFNEPLHTALLALPALVQS